MTPREAIEAAEQAEAETRYRNQLGREMYQAGHADGYEVGYRQAEVDMATRWKQAARFANGPSFAELEERRWGPGGRAHFADPRVGDFPGRETRPQPDPETRGGGQHMSETQFPEDSWVQVRYPLTAEQERGDRAAWPWLPGWVVAECGSDEWEICVQTLELAAEHDGETVYPTCFRDSSELRPAPEPGMEAGA